MQIQWIKYIQQATQITKSKTLKMNWRKLQLLERLMSTEQGITILYMYMHMHPKINWRDMLHVAQNYQANHSILVDHRKPWLPAAGGAFLQYRHTEMWYELHMAPI